MLYLIKSRTIALGKKLKDLHVEVTKSERVGYADFCNYVNGAKNGDTADRIRYTANKVLDDWEAKAKGKENKDNA